MPAPLRVAPVVVTVNREKFSVTIWKMSGTRYVRAHVLPCALGALGHTTPSGMYFVTGRSRTPTWKPPKADWVPADLWNADHTDTLPLPFDNPRNPFAGGFVSMGGNDAGEGVGFHGTKFDPQIGTLASHGCVRLELPSLDLIYRKVPDGTPVFIY